MTPLRTASRSLGRVLVLAAALFAGLLPALPAHAEPSISEIEAQISEEWEKLEPLIEDYNKVHSELVKLQKKAFTGVRIAVLFAGASARAEGSCAA